MNFKGKIALITGASRGIGKAIAEKLSTYDIKIIGTATTQNNVDLINQHLKKCDGIGMMLNITDTYSIKKLLQHINENFGSVDILINNAGIKNDNIALRMKENEWKVTLETNLSGIFYLSKAVIRGMIKNRMGRIISIGSVVGHIGNIGQVNYAASKAGLIGFTKSLSQELASRGITVNVVAPGFIDTDMTKTLTQEQRTRILSRIAIKRFGHAMDVANAVAFLASEEASYITGETLHVNGGLYMS